MPSAAIQMRELRARRARDGLCVQCGQPRAPGRQSCADCLTADAEYMRAYRAKKVDAGLCPQCGTKPLVEGYQACADCRELDRARHRRGYISRKRRRRVRAAKPKRVLRCSWCRIDPRMEGSEYCPECHADFNYA